MASSKVTPTKTKATVKAPKQAKSQAPVAAASSHPTYVEMVVKAIAALTDSSNSHDGAGLQKLAKYINASFNVGDGSQERIKKRINQAVKKCIDSDLITQKSGNGLTGSFRLSAKQKEKFTKGKLFVEKKNAPTSKEADEKNKTPVKKSTAKAVKPSGLKAKTTPTKKSAAVKKSPAAKKKATAAKK